MYRYTIKVVILSVLLSGCNFPGFINAWEQDELKYLNKKKLENWSLDPSKGSSKLAGLWLMDKCVKKDDDWAKTVYLLDYDGSVSARSFIYTNKFCSGEVYDVISVIPSGIVLKDIGTEMLNDVGLVNNILVESKHSIYEDSIIGSYIVGNGRLCFSGNLKFSPFFFSYSNVKDRKIEYKNCFVQFWPP